MKKFRKLNRSKRKVQRKEAQERLAAQTALMMKHPKECCVCDKKFVRNSQTVKTWQVTVREDRVRLTCADCWKVIEEGLERVSSGI